MALFSDKQTLHRDSIWYTIDMKKLIKRSHILLISILCGCILAVSGCEQFNPFVSQDERSQSENQPIIESGLSEQSLTHNGTIREYLMYMSPDYNKRDNIPVIIGFHENGGSHSSFYTASGMQSIAETEPLLLIYPQGAIGGSGTTEWNAYVGENNKSTTDDFGFVETLINQLSAMYSIDTTRIYTIGYSNGAMMAYALACFKSNMIAGVGSVSGTMMSNTILNCAPSHPTGIIHIHGTFDYLLPYYGGVYGYSSVEQVLNYWISANTLNSTPKVTNTNPNLTHYMYENHSENIAIEHYKVIGGYHSWLSIEMDDLTTSKILWNYLAQYSNSGRRQE